jgi:hypothetical protein
VLTKDTALDERTEYFVHLSGKKRIIFVCTEVKTNGLADISNPLYMD